MTKIKFKDLKKNMKVADTYYSNCIGDNWGNGVVLKVLKTRVHINFLHKGLVGFDRAHANNFLMKVVKPKKI